ncbi:hypothetical protein C0213_06600 [Latilactobacillus sakei]|nr:hypothetical protein C0213_06600 [Latilactobacillus sakei]
MANVTAFFVAKIKLRLTNANVRSYNITREQMIEVSLMQTSRVIIDLQQQNLSLYLNGFGVLELRQQTGQSNDLIDAMNYYYNRSKFPQFMGQHLPQVTLVKINRWQNQLDQQVQLIQTLTKGIV